MHSHAACGFLEVCMSIREIIEHTPIVSCWFHDLLLTEIRVPRAFDMRAEWSAHQRANKLPESDPPIIGDGCELLIPIAPKSIYPAWAVAYRQAISLGFGVLARLTIDREQLQGEELAFRWVKPRIDAAVTGYGLTGPILEIEGERIGLSWGFIARFADTAYIPIPDSGSDIVQRSLKVDRLTSLTAR